VNSLKANTVLQMEKSFPMMKWKKCLMLKLQMECKMTEGIDYCFIYPKDDPESVHIRLLTGKYENTVFKYGKVKFEEKNEDVYLLFAYDVLESTIDTPKKLEKDIDFKNYLGDLLVQIMSGNLEQDIIDETGTDDTKESDLQ